MKKTSLTICCLAVFFGFVMSASAGDVVPPGNQPPPPYPIYLVDKSTVINNWDLENALHAFQFALTNDFAPWWAPNTQLIITETPCSTCATIVLRDESDYLGALGYHGVFGDTPYARVFAKDALDSGYAWQAILTHELWEMLADPYANRYMKTNRWWLVEVADPVEDDAYNYSRPAADGSPVPISNFVTPRWYRRFAKPPYDFGGFVHFPQQILPGGYAAYYKGGKIVIVESK
jgi:hypothetical protein